MASGVVFELDRGWDLFAIRLRRIEQAMTNLTGWLHSASMYQRAAVGWRFANQTGLNRAPWPGPAESTPKRRLKKPGLLGPDAAMADTLLLARGWSIRRSSAAMGKNVIRSVKAGDEIKTGPVESSISMWVDSQSHAWSAKQRKDSEGRPTMGQQKSFPYGWWLQNKGRGGKKWHYYFFSDTDADYHVDSLAKHLMAAMRH